MGTQLNYKHLVLMYINNRKVILVVFCYFVFSIVGYLIFSVDFLIPCLFKTFFHFDCWGCGLTTAFIHLLKLDFIEAYQSNPIIFVVVPSLVLLCYKDVIKFYDTQVLKEGIS